MWGVDDVLIHKAPLALALISLFSISSCGDHDVISIGIKADHPLPRGKYYPVGSQGEVPGNFELSSKTSLCLVASPPIEDYITLPNGIWGCWVFSWVQCYKGLCPAGSTAFLKWENSPFDDIRGLGFFYTRTRPVTQDWMPPLSSVQIVEKEEYFVNQQIVFAFIWIDEKGAERSFTITLEQKNKAIDVGLFS